jgi:hypothetical protein
VKGSRSRIPVPCVAVLIVCLILFLRDMVNKHKLLWANLFGNKHQMKGSRELLRSMQIRRESSSVNLYTTTILLLSKKEGDWATRT